MEVHPCCSTTQQPAGASFANEQMRESTTLAVTRCTVPPSPPHLASSAVFSAANSQNI